ncbi:3820_t:CDS:1, partial [Gigaspora margarita]
AQKLKALKEVMNTYKNIQENIFMKYNTRSREPKSKTNETKEIQTEVPIQSLSQEELNREQNVIINKSNSSEKTQDTTAE